MGKLALGTAQFGLNYGVANKLGKIKKRNSFWFAIATRTEKNWFDCRTKKDKNKIRSMAGIH